MSASVGMTDGESSRPLPAAPIRNRGGTVVAHRLIRMKIVCAVCEREGKPGYLGEREPLDNPATTHGICPRHREQALEALPSPSFPDAELLIVVGRDDTDLYDYLSRRFVDVRGVRVILERRRTQQPVCIERRIRQGSVSTLGYTVVRFKPKLPPPSTSD